MSLAKTGLRKISVDNVQYEWTIRQRDTSGQLYHQKKLKAAIQQVTNTKRGLLMVDFGVSPPHTWRNPHKTAITPKLIETVILRAIKDGWNPLATGNYEMTHQVEFIPDPNSSSGEHALHDIRWDR